MSDRLAKNDERDYPRFKPVEGVPVVTQAIQFAKDNGLVSYGKKAKCSPRRLVIHVLRHLTEPYGYRWRAVEDNRYAFDIVDLAWAQGDKKIYPTIGRVYVCPLQRGIDGGINLYFYPKFIIKRDSEGNVVTETDDTRGTHLATDTQFVDRVRETVDSERQEFAMWTHRYAWLPMVRATDADEDNSLNVEINIQSGRGFPDNLTRILVTNLRRMRSTWMLVQMFKRRMPKVDREKDLPLLRQDMGRLFGKAKGAQEKE